MIDSAWCDVDDCPATICRGPHISHKCSGGATVTRRADDFTPCLFCASAPAPSVVRAAWDSLQPKEGE